MGMLIMERFTSAKSILTIHYLYNNELLHMRYYT